MTAAILPAGGYVLDLPLNPTPWQRAGKSGNRYYTKGETQDFRDAFARWLLTCRPRPTPPGLGMPLALTLRFWRNCRNGIAGDIDNLEKQVLDAGNKLLWRDDRQVKRVTKSIEAEGPDVVGRIWMRVAPLVDTEIGIPGGTRDGIAADARYAHSRTHLAGLLRDITPAEHAHLEQYGHSFRELLAHADVDLRDPLVERTVIRMFDVLLMPLRVPSPRPAGEYLAHIAAGLALLLDLNKEPVA